MQRSLRAALAILLLGAGPASALRTADVGDAADGLSRAGTCGAFLDALKEAGTPGTPESDTLLVILTLVYIEGMGGGADISRDAIQRHALAWCMENPLQPITSIPAP